MQLFLGVILLLVFLIYFSLKRDIPSTYVKSQIDNKYYLVRDLKDKQSVANELSYIRINTEKLIDHMIEKNDSKYIEYIDVLKNKFKNVVITENVFDFGNTSYSINKGDQLVFCVRSRSVSNVEKMHDNNLIMYVVLHEISHIACPEYGHTDKFKEIFKYITQNAIEMGIYIPIDFKHINTEYCGMKITDSIV